MSEQLTCPLAKTKKKSSSTPKQDRWFIDLVKRAFLIAVLIGILYLVGNIDNVSIPDYKLQSPIVRIN